MTDEDFNPADFAGYSAEKLDELAEKAAKQIARAHLFTHGMALYALFSTHPNPQLLKKHFVLNVEKLVESLKQTQTGDLTWRSIEKNAEKFLDCLP